MAELSSGLKGQPLGTLVLKGGVEMMWKSMSFWLVKVSCLYRGLEVEALSGMRNKLKLKKKKKKSPEHLTRISLPRRRVISTSNRLRTERETLRS